MITLTRMFFIVLIIWLAFNSDNCSQIFRQFFNTDENFCHDGGCLYRTPEDHTEKCLCNFSENIMNGKYCGVYTNKCLINPCKNNGKCKSGIGHHVCECGGQFYGVNCEIPIKTGKHTNSIIFHFIFTTCMDTK